LKNQDVDPPGAQTHRKREGRHTTHQGSRTLPIHRFSSSIAAVRSHPRAAPFSYTSSFIGPYRSLSQTFVYVKPESSIASERENRLSAR